MRWVVVAAVLWASTASAERLRGPDGVAKDVPSESVEFALKDGYTRIPRIPMRAPEGGSYDVPEDQVAAAIDRGFWKMTPSEVAAMRDAEWAKMRADDSAAERWRWAEGLALVVGIVAAIAALLRPWRFWGGRQP